MGQESSVDYNLDVGGDSEPDAGDGALRDEGRIIAVGLHSRRCRCSRNARGQKSVVELHWSKKEVEWEREAKLASKMHYCVNDRLGSRCCVQLQASSVSRAEVARYFFVRLTQRKSLLSCPVSGVVCRASVRKYIHNTEIEGVEAAHVHGTDSSSFYILEHSSIYMQYWSTVHYAESRAAMATATPWLLLLCLAAASAGSGVLQARAQPDSKGFISIDCGLPGKTSYMDDANGLSYAPDAGFIDTGTNHNISVEYVKPQSSLSKRYLNVRSFPDGMRNRYTLRSLVPGLKYLIRTTFFYGNYDGLDRTPQFDLHIGVNFWKLVNVSSPGYVVQAETIVLVSDDFVQVCLVNTGAGTPFISGLDLRPLKRSMYPQVSGTAGLVLAARINFGTADEYTSVRYPKDPYDRIWSPRVNTRDWTSISTTNTVDNGDDGRFEAPTTVMQTAIRPRDATEDIELTWEPEPEPNDPSPGYIVILHFSELQILPNNAIREMNVTANGKPWYTTGFTPRYLISGAAYINDPMRHDNYNISISATTNSTLPPIINAIEIFSVISTTNLTTDSQDVSAITAIKVKYQVQNNWMGDPCVPKNMSWDRLAPFI